MTDIDQKDGREVAGRACNKCGEWKPFGDFPLNKGGPMGRKSICKYCVKMGSRDFRQKFPEKEKASRDRYKLRHPEAVKESSKKAYDKNKDSLLQKRSKRYQENKEKERSVNAAWAARNKERVLELGRISDAKRRSTPKGKLDNSISAGVHRGVKRGAKAGRRTFDILGYTLEQLMAHLEGLFLPGMSWENYGQWHVDHRIPRSAFNYESPDDLDFKRAWSLSNLQPLWALDNMSKGGKLYVPFQPSLLLRPVNDNVPYESKQLYLTNL